MYEVEQDMAWTVVDDIAGKPLWEFRGDTSHALEGGQWSVSTGSHGWDEVALGADRLRVLARDSDEVTCHPLRGARAGVADRRSRVIRGSAVASSRVSRP